MKRLLLPAAIAGVAATVGFSAPAYADQGDHVSSDAAFLTALSGAGLSYRGADRAIPAGRAVCQLMDAGLSPTDTVLAVQQTNPGFTLQNAAQFAAISATAYCPGHM